MWRLATALASLCATALLIGCVSAGDEWMEGRATFYEDNTEGSCRYGANIPALYAAWPDSQAGFPACGECYEVSCVNRNFRDGYGKSVQRSSVCKDESTTVVVKIVDSCPCIHENFYSNQRWCCGDMRHIDLGKAAFGKLADEHYGVIGAKWRKVPCPADFTAAAPLPLAEPESTTELSAATAAADAAAAVADIAPPPEPVAVAPAPKPSPKPAAKKSAPKPAPKKKSDDNNDFFSSSSGRLRIRWPKWFDDL